MEKKHGELKIMTAKEMVDLFADNYKTFECVFASIDITKEELHTTPMQDLNLEEVYDEAEGWCGIRVKKSPFPFDGDDYLVAIGDFGYGAVDVFNFREDDYDDYGFPIERMYEAVARCEYIDNFHSEKELEDKLDDVLVITETVNKREGNKHE